MAEKIKAPSGRAKVEIEAVGPFWDFQVFYPESSFRSTPSLLPCLTRRSAERRANRVAKRLMRLDSRGKYTYRYPRADEGGAS